MFFFLLLISYLLNTVITILIGTVQCINKKGKKNLCKHFFCCKKFSIVQVPQNLLKLALILFRYLHQWQLRMVVFMPLLIGWVIGWIWLVQLLWAWHYHRLVPLVYHAYIPFIFVLPAKKVVKNKTRVLDCWWHQQLFKSCLRKVVSYELLL